MADDNGMFSIPAVQIGTREIGPGRPVYIIAEAGVNHDGDIQKAKRLIDAARQAGADAVKFQIFSAERLVTAGAAQCTYQKSRDPAEDQQAMLRRLELAESAFLELSAHARKLQIDFLATPFGLTELATLRKLNSPAVKIASPDLVNVPLLTAAADTDLPLIVSTGAASLTEIDNTVALLRSKQRHSNLILLHCVSAYPTPPSEARLRCIDLLARRFELPVGFSDHTAESDFSGLAVASGALVLEKHLTLDKRSSGPDHFFSLEPDEFSRYVQAARRASAALGSSLFHPSAAEVEVRKLARGGIVASRAIPSGSIVTPESLIVQRPAQGISAHHWNEIVGRRAKTDIPASTRLDWSMIE